LKNTEINKLRRAKVKSKKRRKKTTTRVWEM
jgi:hypothetical protein